MMDTQQTHLDSLASRVEGKYQRSRKVVQGPTFVGVIEECEFG